MNIGRRDCLSVMAVALLGLAPAVHAIMAVTYPVRLGKADRAHVERTACEEPHGVKLEHLRAYTYAREKPLKIEVDVECQSHGNAENNPAHYVAHCDNHAGRWNCDAPTLTISTIIAEHTVEVQPRDVDAGVALSIVRAVAAAKTVDDVDLVASLSDGPCRVERIGHGVPKSEWMVDCGGMTAFVAQRCSGESCTYEVIHAGVVMQ